LRGSGDVFFYSQVSEERLDFGTAHLSRLAHVGEDIVIEGLDITLPRMASMMLALDGFPNRVKEFLGTLFDRDASAES
jgi:hypothetical protein